MKNLIFFALLFLMACVAKNNLPTTSPTTTVNIHKDSLRVFGRVNCSDQQSVLEIYLVNLMQFDPGKLVVTQSKDSFDFVLSQEDMKNFTHLQFIKGNYQNTLKISDLKSGFNIIKVQTEMNVIAKKPAIYLYPTQVTEVEITHEFKGKILNTYPSYENGWSVTAYPDGKLVNHSDKRTYNYLFWDGICNFPVEHYQFNSGFIVERNKTVTFLQEKLAILGLNNTEINDFIVFWLPELSQNQYNFIHFSINDDIDHTSYLYVKPQPDTTIRVFMEFKGLENKSDYPALPEQNLPQLTRKGFTMVEWGGASFSRKWLDF